MTTRNNRDFPGVRVCNNGTHFHSKVIASHDMKIQLRRAETGDVAEIQAASLAVLDRFRKRNSGNASSGGRGVGLRS
jgi:hypothetical protein